MKVYSLKGNYDYEGSQLFGVFKTVDQAKEWLRGYLPKVTGEWKINTGSGTDPEDQTLVADSITEYEIETWELDD